MPWLDKKKILPGQDWNYMITNALREANYIIILLSNSSVQKRGYIQREFKAALNFVEEKREDDTYIIPLKTDNCSVPEKLSKFQWIEYDDNNCFSLIVTSLNSQREKYEMEERSLMALKECYPYISIQKQFEYSHVFKTIIVTTTVNLLTLRIIV